MGLCLYIALSIYALYPTFTSLKASQKFGAAHCVVGLTFLKWTPLFIGKSVILNNNASFMRQNSHQTCNENKIKMKVDTWCEHFLQEVVASRADPYSQACTELKNVWWRMPSQTIKLVLSTWQLEIFLSETNFSLSSTKQYHKKSKQISHDCNCILSPRLT